MLFQCYVRYEIIFYLLFVRVSLCTLQILFNCFCFVLFIVKICLKFDEKFSIAHQAPPVPLFPIQKMFAYSPTKGDPSTSAAGRLMGSPSDKWEDLRAVYDHLVEDVNREYKQALLPKFIGLHNITNTTKNRVKLKSVESAYEFGYKYPKWMLRVSYFLFFFCFFS